jgi:hypothetical protein
VIEAAAAVPCTLQFIYLSLQTRAGILFWGSSSRWLTEDDSPKILLRAWLRQRRLLLRARSDRFWGAQLSRNGMRTLMKLELPVLRETRTLLLETSAVLPQPKRVRGPRAGRAQAGSPSKHGAASARSEGRSTTSRHARECFSCGADSLNRFLRTQASQDVRCKANGVFIRVVPRKPNAECHAELLHNLRLSAFAGRCAIRPTLARSALPISRPDCRTHGGLGRPAARAPAPLHVTGQENLSRS